MQKVCEKYQFQFKLRFESKVKTVDHASLQIKNDSYLPTNADCALKSPVEFQRLPRPVLPLFTVFTDCGRGEGDGAGDIELLLGESD